MPTVIDNVLTEGSASPPMNVRTNHGLHTVYDSAFTVHETDIRNLACYLNITARNIFRYKELVPNLRTKMVPNFCSNNVFYANHHTVPFECTSLKPVYPFALFWTSYRSLILSLFVYKEIPCSKFRFKLATWLSRTSIFYIHSKIFVEFIVFCLFMLQKQYKLIRTTRKGTSTEAEIFHSRNQVVQTSVSQDELVVDVVEVTFVARDSCAMWACVPQFLERGQCYWWKKRGILQS